MDTVWTMYPSPIGDFLLVADDSSTPATLSALHFEPHRPDQAAGLRRDDTAFAHVREELDAYFAGDGVGFKAPMELRGTPFQKAVWAALREIPYGETITYGQLAARVGNPAAARAVGMANNRNPIAVIVPCHRVVGSNGSLIGYGGGLDRKQWLLEHEAKVRLTKDWAAGF